MLKNSDFRYKLSIGEKFKSVLKTIATIGLTASLMLGATFGISACGKKTPSAEIDPPKQETPIEPDDPTKPDQPENPDQPDTPDQPENPDQPTNPDPDQPVDPDDPSKPGDNDPDDEPQKPVEPEFVLDEQAKIQIEKNLADIMNEMCIDSGYGYKDPTLQQAYLRASETGLVDTIGCVMITNGGTSILYDEMQIKTTTHDITWEEIHDKGFKFGKYDLIEFPTKVIFKSTNKIHDIQNYNSEYFDDAFKKTFNITDEEYSSALFTGWTYEEAPQNAYHYLTFISNNTIKTTRLLVDKNGNGMFNAFVENYLNAKDNSKWTQTAITETQLIPTEYLDYVVDFTDKETTAENQ